MSTPWLLSVAALGLLQEATTQEEIWWDLGLLARSVESGEISTENRFGSDFGWFPRVRWPVGFGPEQGGSGEPAFQVENIAGELVVRAQQSTWYSGHEVVLQLNSDGARVQAMRSDDVHIVNQDGSPWFPVTEVAGVIALSSDGLVVALDFEIFLFEHLWSPSGLFGHVFLGASGVALVEDLLARPLPEDSSQFDGLRSVALAEALQSRGWVDGFGRRQGVWTVRDQNGCKRTETTWSDGRPHGRFAKWEESGWLSQETSFRNGLEHGERYSWYENGELESLEHLVDGVTRGLRVEFGPNGAKMKEFIQRSKSPSAEFLRDLSRLRTRE